MKFCSTVSGSSPRPWAGSRVPGSASSRAAVHLQRVEQQHDAVGGAEAADVLFHGLLGPQVLARGVEEGQQRSLRLRPAPRPVRASEAPRPPAAGERSVVKRNTNGGRFGDPAVVVVGAGSRDSRYSGPSYSLGNRCRV